MRTVSPRLDEIFAPDKLRANWSQPAAPAADTPASNPLSGNIHCQYLEVKRLIAENFENASILSAMLEQISQQIHRLYSLDSTLPCLADEDADGRKNLIMMLETLEESIWALEVANRGKTR